MRFCMCCCIFHVLVSVHVSDCFRNLAAFSASWSLVLLGELNPVVSGQRPKRAPLPCIPGQSESRSLAFLGEQHKQARSVLGGAEMFNLYKLALLRKFIGLSPRTQPEFAMRDPVSFVGRLPVSGVVRTFRVAKREVMCRPECTPPAVVRFQSTRGRA